MNAAVRCNGLNVPTELNGSTTMDTDNVGDSDGETVSAPAKRRRPAALIEDDDDDD